MKSSKKIKELSKKLTMDNIHELLAHMALRSQVSLTTGILKRTKDHEDRAVLKDILRNEDEMLADEAKNYAYELLGDSGFTEDVNSIIDVLAPDYAKNIK